jgi:hypothetical protein
MKKTDLYWLAGLLEGEGSFQSPPPSDPNSPRVCLHMTDKDVVEKAQNLINAGHIYFEEARQENWPDSWKLTVKGKPAVKLMMKVKPLMGERRTKQIENAVEEYDEHLDAKSKSPYSSDEVITAIKRIEEGEALTDISEDLEMKYQFVKDLSAGRTWQHLTN